MFVIKIPYPPPKKISQFVQTHDLRSLERAIHFPERGISYIVAGCKEADWERCVKQVREAVSLQSRGMEPDRLEITIKE